ncbi:IS3 family transposase [Flavobacterium plurextorum]|uniref:IS3 family transposase n=1 Tax=Flavobacterium TaxID=237 RepID=UPI00214D1CEC|nr:MULTISPECIES: IS3 family transposase [Flavobacterium]UUW08339.1 IS3 family transposase [Flavobacterium plurextorum]
MTKRKTPEKYDFSFKEKAVLLSYERHGTSLAKLEKELGLYTAALSTWRREYAKFNTSDTSENNYVKVNIERQKIQEFEKKTKKSDLKFKILQSAGKYLYQGRHMVFCFMASNEKSYSIRLMCEVLDIHRCTYRRWKNGYITERQKRKSLLQKEITYIFFAFKERYGCPRITIELQNAGYKISCTTVYEYMKELGLSSKVKKNK